MKAPFILAVTGPAGSGKSTTASRLAKEINKCVNIEVDHVKHFIVNGFIYEDKPEGVSQWELLGKNIGMLAKNFQEAGYNVIISGYLKEVSWESIQKHIVIDHKVLLLPHVDAVTRRDAGRNEDDRMGAEAVQEHHDYFSTSSFYDDFIKIDSTGHSIDETLEEIRGLL